MFVSAGIRMIAVSTTGLAAGILLGHWRGVSTAVPKLDPSSFLQLQQTIHVQFVPLMPVLLFGAVIGALAWSYSLRSYKSTLGFWLVVASATGMVAVLAMTLLINVPINRELMTWRIDAPPPSLTVTWARWEMSHSIRTGIAVAAFALQALALSSEAAKSHAGSA